MNRNSIVSILATVLVSISLFVVGCGGDKSTNPLANDSVPLANDSVAVSIVASTTSPLTERTLNNNVIALTLNNGTWEHRERKIADALTVSGFDGVTLGTFGDAWFGMKRVSDTEIMVELDFDGTDFDEALILTFTVGADAIAEYNGPALTTQVPVTAVIEVPDPPPSPDPPLNPQPGEQRPQPPARQQPQPEPPRLPDPPLNDLGACAAGMTLKPGESCSYVAGKANVVFSVRQDGSACREGGPVEKVEEIFGVKVNVNVKNQNICRNDDIKRDDAFNSNFSASKNPDGSWTINRLP